MKKLINGENQIQKIYKIRQRIKELHCIEEQLVTKSIKHIERYGKLEKGRWTAVVDMVEGRHPKWKEEFLAELGAGAALDVIEHTPVSICKKLIVLYKGIRMNGGKK